MVSSVVAFAKVAGPPVIRPNHCDVIGADSGASARVDLAYTTINVGRDFVLRAVPVPVDALTQLLDRDATARSGK